MSDRIRAVRKWPPQCCVPAFVYSALLVKSIAVPVPEVIPSILGVRVAPDQPNPFGLALADDRHPPGIRAEDAEREINRFLAELETSLHFRCIPFLQINFGLWEEVLDAALSKDIVVGLGVNFGILMQTTPPRAAQHVLRVLARSDQRIEVIDDSGETVPAHFSVTTQQLSKAVLSIPNGFWMIGAEEDLHLPFTLPWSAKYDR